MGIKYCLGNEMRTGSLPEEYFFILILCYKRPRCTKCSLQNNIEIFVLSIIIVRVRKCVCSSLNINMTRLVFSTGVKTSSSGPYVVLRFYDNVMIHSNENVQTLPLCFKNVIQGGYSVSITRDYLTR